jgi:hypothetical protein
MPSRRKPSKGRKGGRRKGGVEPGAASLKYSGPIWDRGALGNRDMVTANLVYQTTQSSNGAGIMTGVFDQTMTGMIGWSYWAGLYDEFRVLGMQLEFFPVNRYSKLTAVCTPGVGVIDRDSNGPLISLANGFGYASCRILSLEDPWADRHFYKGNCEPPITFRMDGVNDATWTTTAAPSGTNKPAIKFYFSGLTASTPYGLFVQRALVQFRGKVL